jgi:hypothetical protein
MAELPGTLLALNSYEARTAERAARLLARQQAHQYALHPLAKARR